MIYVNNEQIAKLAALVLGPWRGRGGVDIPIHIITERIQTILKKLISQNFVWMFVIENDGCGRGGGALKSL